GVNQVVTAAQPSECPNRARHERHREQAPAFRRADPPMDANPAHNLVTLDSRHRMRDYLDRMPLTNELLALRERLPLGTALGGVEVADEIGDPQGRVGVWHPLTRDRQ